MTLDECRKMPVRQSGCRKRWRKRRQALCMWKKMNQLDEENLQPDVVSHERLLESDSQKRLTKASQKHVERLRKKHAKLFEPRTYDPAAKPHVVDGVEIGFDVEEREDGIKHYKSPKPMRLGLTGEKRLAEEIEKIIQRGILVRAKNPRHVSNVFLVPKKNPDGSTRAWRVVSNLAPVNRITCAVHGAIPAVTEIWDRLSKA